MVLFGRFACCAGMVLIISDVLISVRAKFQSCDDCWVTDPCECGQKCCLTWNTYCKNGYDGAKDERCGFPCYSCAKWPDLVEGEDGDDAPGGGGAL